MVADRAWVAIHALALSSTELVMRRLTVFIGLVAVGMVQYKRRPSINRLQSPSKLSPVHISRLVRITLPEARHQVVKNRLLSMAPLELRLPQVMVRVDKARADDLATTVDKLSASRCDEALADLGDAIGLDQDVCVAEGVHVILVIVEEEGATSEED